MKKLADVNFPIVALRFSFIKVNYTVKASTTAPKSMQAPPCYVRVIIHNGLLHKFFCFY